MGDTIRTPGTPEDARLHGARWTRYDGEWVGQNTHGWCATDHDTGRWAGYTDTPEAAVRLLRNEEDPHALPKL